MKYKTKDTPEISYLVQNKFTPLCTQLAEIKSEILSKDIFLKKKEDNVTWTCNWKKKRIDFVYDTFWNNRLDEDTRFDEMFILFARNFHSIDKLFNVTKSLQIKIQKSRETLWIQIDITFLSSLRRFDNKCINIQRRD